MINYMTRIVGKSKLNYILLKEHNAQIVLTQRKIEHIVLAASGFTNQEIAQILFISKSTVKKTFEDIFKKLNVRDRANLVHKAWALGLLDSNIEKQILIRYNIIDE